MTTEMGRTMASGDPSTTFDALAELRAVTAAFEAEVRSTEADGTLEQKTALPDWTGRQLVAHLAALHVWCAEIVSSGGKVVREPEGPLIGNAGDWYGQARTTLLATLSAHAPEEPAFTFQRDNRTVGFWRRRMLHETLIHLWDLRSIRSADGPVPVEVSPVVHADGVTELFEAYSGRVDVAEREAFQGTLLLRATDIQREWRVGPGLRLLENASPHAGAPHADATVSATAGTLLLLVWNRYRVDNAAVTITGDAAVAEAFVSSRRHP